MIVFPNAKINLGLHVVRKRNDGYHDIETAFYPVPIYDILEVVVTGSDNAIGVDKSFAPEIQPSTTSLVLKSGIEVEWSSSGLVVDGTPDRNLCLQACELYDLKFGLPGNLAVHLHKIIPMGAGLGGGSADAAFMLKTLNDFSGLRADNEALLKMAATLGSDCSFFIKNTPVLATGRGELLGPCGITLSGYQIVIVKPAIHLNTKTAFEGIRPVQPAISISQIMSAPVESWKNILKNDFEPVMFTKYPEIARIKQVFYDNGAAYASMTGSGSAVYGLFKGTLPDPGLFPGSFYFSASL